jgi:hypothetical protein
VTTSTHVSFRKSTFAHVDRVLVLRINVEGREASIEELLDCPAAELGTVAQDGLTEFIYRVRTVSLPIVSLDQLAVTGAATHDGMRVVQYENGSIIVESNGVAEPQAMPVLRMLAAQLGVSLHNSAGGLRNTRQLGAEILGFLQKQPEELFDR